MNSLAILGMGFASKKYVSETCDGKKKKMTPTVGKQDQTKQDSNNQGKDAQMNNRQDNRTQGGK